MAEQNNQAERAAFEAWASDPIRAEKLPLDRWPGNDGYKDTRTYIAFYGWKAGREVLAADRRKQAMTQTPRVGSIEDYAQFHTLHGAWLSAREYWQDDNAPQVLDAWRKFIDYIDGRTAAIEAHNRAGKEQG